MTDEKSLLFVRKLAITAACASLILAFALPADRIGYIVFGAFWAVLYAVLRARSAKTSGIVSSLTPSEPSPPGIARPTVSNYPPTLMRRTDGFALACAQCGAEAINFRVDAAGVHGSQFLLTTGSYGVPLWAGEAGQRIATLLEEGKSRELVDYIESLNPGQWEVYCPSCDRIYCQLHLAAQTIWSGSWPDGMRVICPNGHSRRFD